MSRRTMSCPLIHVTRQFARQPTTCQVKACYSNGGFVTQHLQTGTLIATCLSLKLLKSLTSGSLWRGSCIENGFQCYDQGQHCLLKSMLSKTIILTQNMRGSRRFCQRGSNFEDFLLVEGREQLKVGLHRPADDGPTLNSGLVAVILRGVRTPCPPLWIRGN